MGRTAEEIEKTMTARELTDWVAFERVYGSILPHERIDVGLAQLSFYIVSMLGQRKRGQRLKLRDFFPKWLRDLEHRRPTDERQLLATFQSWVSEGDSHADH